MLFELSYIHLLASSVLVLLLINLLFVIVWLMRKPKVSVMSFIVLLSAWNVYPLYFQYNYKKTPPNGQKVINLQTYNIHRFSYDEYSNTRDQTLLMAQHNKTDILCLQEFSEKAEYLSYAEYFPYDTRSENPTWDNMRIYSSYPIICDTIIKFEQSQQQFQIADLQIQDNDTIRIVSVHMQTTGVSSNRRLLYEIKHTPLMNQSKGEAIYLFSNVLLNNAQKRLEQAHTLRNIIKESPYPIIVCGDFNDVPLSHTYKVIDRELTDAFRSVGQGYGRSFGRKLKWLRLDYVFHSEAIIPISFSYKASQYSDHLPAFFSFVVE